MGNTWNRTKETQSYNNAEIKFFPVKKISFQAGVTHDYFNDRFSNTLPYQYFAIFPGDDAFSFEHRKENHNTETYGYGRYISEKIIIGIGIRKNIPSKEQSDYTSYQGSLRYNFLSHSSALLSAGKYHGYTIPNYFMQSFDPVSASQYSVEYNYKSDRTHLGVAAYKKKETASLYYSELGTSAASEKDIKGIEVSAEHRVSSLTLSSSYTWLDSKFNNGNGWHKNMNSMDYLVKLAVSYRSLKLFNCAVSCILRPGHYYTPVVNVRETQTVSGFMPLFGAYNSQQLGSYSTLDITLSKLIYWKGKLFIPFFLLTNIVNRSNQSAPLYSRDFRTITDYWHYQKRLVYFGIQVTL